jgi:hypothetical protein
MTGRHKRRAFIGSIYHWIGPFEQGNEFLFRRWDHVRVAVYIRNDLSIRSPEVGTYTNDQLLDGAVYPGRI